VKDKYWDKEYLFFEVSTIFLSLRLLDIVLLLCAGSLIFWTGYIS